MLYNTLVFVIFARHGETVSGSNDKFTGLSDSPLTETGRNQAYNLGNFAKEHGVSKIITSPLKRTIETAQIVSAVIGIPFEVNPIFSEICYGEWEQTPKNDLKNTLLWKHREKDLFNFIHPGKFNNIPGESYAMLYERLKPFLVKELKKFDKTLIISHLGVMRAVLFYLTGKFQTTTIKNNEIIKVFKSNSGFSYELIKT